MTFDASSSPTACATCGQWHGGICQRIRAIEYYESGIIKRIEYVEPSAVVVGGLTINIGAPEPGEDQETFSDRVTSDVQNALRRAMNRASEPPTAA